MVTLFKFLLSFVASFLILTIPVSEEKTVFSFLHETVGPYQTPAFEALKETFQFGVKKSKKVFTNTDPQADEVSKQQSAVKKDKPSEEKFHDTYTHEEKEFLLKVLKGDHE